jgi:hypothetical protein
MKSKPLTKKTIEEDHETWSRKNKHQGIYHAKKHVRDFRESQQQLIHIMVEIQIQVGFLLDLILDASLLINPVGQHPIK